MCFVYVYVYVHVYVYVYSQGTCASHMADASAYVIFCSRAHVDKEELGIQAHTPTHKQVARMLWSSALT